MTIIKSTQENIKMNEDFINTQQQNINSQNTGLAITSMILGICSIVLCLGPIAGLPAVICGHIAKGKIKRGEAGGSAMALTGIITGYIGLLLILPAMLLPALSMARESARKISCTSNLKIIGLSLRMYSNVYDEAFPHLDGAKGLEMLRKNGFLEAPQCFVCPSAGTKPAAYGAPLTEATVDYQYFGGHTESDSVDVILACDKENNHDKYGNVLFIDGHVKGYAGSGWKQSAEK